MRLPALLRTCFNDDGSERHGRLDRHTHLPARHPTMQALCGPDLATLYVTSTS